MIRRKTFWTNHFGFYSKTERLGFIHWRSDISTPRGPDLSIRPKPEQIIEMIDNKRFNIAKKPFLLEPYHYGLVISKI